MQTLKRARVLSLILFSISIMASNAHAYSELQKRLDKAYLTNKMEQRQLSQRDRINQRLEDKSRQLESVMLSEMIEPMFPQGKESMLYGDTESSKIYRMFMIQEYAEIMSKQGGIGVAEQVYDDLKLQYERKHHGR